MLVRVHDCVSHSGCLDGSFHIMRSQNMRALENQCCLCGQIAVKPLRDRRVFSIPGQGTPQKGFS